MLSWLHCAQIKYFEILPGKVRLSSSTRQRHWAIAHCTKNSLSSLCTSQHKHEQAEFPDHMWIYFGNGKAPLHYMQLVRYVPRNKFILKIRVSLSGIFI